MSSLLLGFNITKIMCSLYMKQVLRDLIIIFCLFLWVLKFKLKNLTIPVSSSLPCIESLYCFVFVVVKNYLKHRSKGRKNEWLAHPFKVIQWWRPLIDCVRNRLRWTHYQLFIKEPTLKKKEPMLNKEILAYMFITPYLTHKYYPYIFIKLHEVY